MKESAVILLFIAAVAGSCSRQSEDRSEKAEPQPTDSMQILLPQADVSYSELYGLYTHESNHTGFHAEIEINPMGNDLQFLITLNQPGCLWQTQGTLAMMYHFENEYAGFYDSETCRLVFTFFLPLHQLKLEEAGVCVALPPRCSISGIYRKSY